jgi:Tol biopolymer transport system component
MMIRIIVRLAIVILLPIGIVCVVAVAIGALLPTKLILAEVYFYSQQIEKLMLIDINRKLPVYYPLPTEYRSPFNPSPDGRRVIVFFGTAQQQIMVWDIFTGRRVSLSDIRPNCLAVSATWLRDSRHLTFSCQTNIQGGMMGGIHLLDFETGAVNLFYSQSQLLHDSQWSPDLTRIGINVNDTVRVVSADGTQELFLTPPNVWQRFLGWSADAESVLVYGQNTIQRYTFATDTWEMLVSDMTITYRPALSPDGRWVAFVSGLRNGRAYAFNLHTLELIPLTSPEIDIVGVDIVAWSPDSQWLVVRVLDGSRSPQYLAKPDTSEIRLIGNDITDLPIWSPDATRMMYRVAEWDGKEFHTYIVIWDMPSDAQTVIPITQLPQWSPDGDRVAFVQYDNGDQALYVAENGTIHRLTGADLYVSRIIFVR